MDESGDGVRERVPVVGRPISFRRGTVRPRSGTFRDIEASRMLRKLVRWYEEPEPL